MSSVQTAITWEEKSLEKFNAMIKRLPLFHREIAKEVVVKKAVENARERGSVFVEEPDIARAFFSEVPKTFYSLMVRLLEEVGFNYREYEPK